MNYQLPNVLQISPVISSNFNFSGDAVRSRKKSWLMLRLWLFGAVISDHYLGRSELSKLAGGE